MSDVHNSMQLKSFASPSAGRLANLQAIASAAAVAYLAYLVVLVVYRLYFHPLAKHPGPAWMIVSDMPYQLYSQYLGRFPTHLALDLHRRYGKVVRIGTNRLSVDGSVGWTDVCGHRLGGKETEFRKDPSFFPPASPPSVISAPDRDNHRRQRRVLAHAFSAAALQEHEPIITYYVDLFMSRLSEHAKGGTQSLDMVAWLNYLTFDIISDLAFGESFGSLQTSSYHFWVEDMFMFLKGGSRMKFFQYLGLDRLLMFMATISGDGSIAKFFEFNRYATEKAEARMALGPEPLAEVKGQVDGDGKPKMQARRDFMTYMLRKSGSGELSHQERRGNSNVLILGGSETTATNLSTLFYQLGLPQNRLVKQAVVAEVRSRFANEAEITLRSVQAAALPLLHGCIEESLRIHPPVPEMPPRVSPGAEVGGRYVPKGTVVVISQLATFHNPDNFVDPDLFRPQRFLPPDHPMHDQRLAEGSDLAALKPFSFGPRDCVGKNFAYAEMRLVAARVLLRFDFELAEGMDDWAKNQRAFVVWEKGPLMVKLTERKA